MALTVQTSSNISYSGSGTYNDPYQIYLVDNNPPTGPVQGFITFQCTGIGGNGYLILDGRTSSTEDCSITIKTVEIYKNQSISFNFSNYFELQPGESVQIVFTSPNIPPLNTQFLQGFIYVDEVVPPPQVLPTSLSIIDQPYVSSSGSLLSTQPSLCIVDQFNSQLSGYDTDVQVSLVVLSGSATLTGTTTVSTVNGVANFTDLVITGNGLFYLQFDSNILALNSAFSNQLFFQPNAGNPNPPIPVKPKRSYVSGSVPAYTDLEVNEFAINVADRKGYIRDSNDIVHLLFDGYASGGGGTGGTVYSVGISSTDFDVTNSPVTTSGFIGLDLATQAITVGTYGDGSNTVSITVNSKGIITGISENALATSNWDAAYGWGDHSLAGYLTSETDPVYSASTAAGITSTDTGNWNTAYGWGDHSTAGYLTTETDPTFTASAAYSITSTDTTNWNTAYGWGDHSVAGYITTETDPVFTASDAASITATDISNWNAKPDTVTVTSTGSTITVTDNTVGGAVSFNVETPQGIATTDSPTFAGLTAAGLVYPTTDGTSGQVIVTDGAGNLSFATVGGGASALDDLTDVSITTVANDNILRYNGTSSQWENVAINTDGISEGNTNLYYTDARTRAALSAGTGISFNSTNGVITNSSPDQTVVLTAGTGISTSGTYPNFTITNSAPDQTVKLTAGTGISTSGTYPNFTITNSSPDQTVTLTAGSGISVTGTYPSFTIGSTITQYTDSDARKSISAGTGISYSSTTGIITNSSPDQTVTLTAGTGISVTGTYPSFTITNSSPSSGGTVTSVGLSAPTGMKVTNSPITSNGTITLSMDTGYALPTSASQTNWDTAYTNRITSLTTTGSSGSATLVSNTLNVPTYTLAGLGGIKLTDLSSTATGLTYTNTTGVFSFTSGYSIPTNSSQTNWDSAYSERRQWDGGSTNLVAATGRTSLGGTTVGSNLFTLTNPSAVTFLKVNADNTITAESASTFRTSIGAGTGNGTITSIATTSPITGGTITSTGTIGINASSTNTASYVVQRDASGNFSAGTITASLSGNATSATNIAGGGAGQIPYQSAANTTAMLAAGTSGQILTSNGSSAPTWGNVLPSGVMQMYGGSVTQSVSSGTLTTTAPSGWALCDGSAISRTTYSALFTAIGTTYGTGDGSTTFNIPDLRSRSPIGAGTGSGLSARTLGTNYGAESVTLAANQIPTLTSEKQSANHTHSYSLVGSTGSPGVYGIVDNNTTAKPNTITTGNQSADHTHSITNASQQSTSILHPTLTVNYIIKL